MFRSRRAVRNESWEGVVAGKSRNMSDGSGMYHYVKVRFSDGEVKKVRIDRGLWDSLATGDGIVKQAGADPAKK